MAKGKAEEHVKDNNLTIKIGKRNIVKNGQKVENYN